ncbi:ATP-binding protein [Bifidobacterium canis]|uniref:ATPase (AAA+ superfamily) n=1 Tax=Bifidobacterium canis TaxID=2610880 RepID=A0A7K1J305_9BIFI|nr:ATP-binding protein [Bifidobacterium canis]MUH59038.1 ATPase (AAA+ superfamily) [Bifidobacterium canis]
MDTKQYIDRPQYMHLLDSYRGSEHIKVLQGIRRCGKSSLLEMLRAHLLTEGVPERNIYRKRFDEFGLPLEFTAQQLTTELQQMLRQSDDSQMRYVFLDEIQEVRDWPKVVRGLHTLGNVDVYITGSNAHLLSTDLATALAGRTTTIDVHPLSFGEYLEFTRTSFPDRARLSHDELFADYVRFGGMPTLFALREFTQEGIARELDSVYNSVILRDVAQHLQIRDISLLNRLVAYLFQRQAICSPLGKSSEHSRAEDSKPLLRRLRPTSMDLCARSFCSRPRNSVFAEKYAQPSSQVLCGRLRLTQYRDRILLSRLWVPIGERRCDRAAQAWV